MTIREIIKSFYDGLAQKSDGWQKHLSEDVVFTDSGLRIHEEGKEAFIKSFNSFLRAVEAVRVKQMIVDDNDACVIASYDFASPKGAQLTLDSAEIWRVKDGKLGSLTIYFDLTAFRDFMGR